MLEDLDIKNFALIESAHIEINRGFTVLSGETGAGKSILIGSLAFLLGGKGGMELIRSGCHDAQVSGTFLVESKDAFGWLEEHGIAAEEDRVIVRRVIRDTGKSSAWISGTPVTKADLASFAAFLVDIHGQHDQQSLMKVSEHRRYLDIYAGLVEETAAFTELYGRLVEKRRLMEEINENEAEHNNRMDMLSYAVNEISEADLKENEDTELEAEEMRLSSYEKLFASVDEVTSAFEGDDSSGGILNCMRRSVSSSARCAEFDPSLSALSERLQSAFYEVEDIAGEFRRYASSLVYDPDRLAEVQDRLEFISRLKKKYVHRNDASVADVIRYKENAESELEKLTFTCENKDALAKEIDELGRKVYAAAKALSAKRKSASEKMSGDVECILKKLGMKDTRFSVDIKEKPGNEVEQQCGPYGMDNIEFLISANPGSPLLPLAKIASGGELSRVMLAMKTILSQADLAGTLVFDEIDTGIGGEVAVSVGEHMKKLAERKQILCITHLASIAVYAHNQIKIKKGVDGNTTATNVFEITGEDRVREIARMLSGDDSSQASLDHAEAMLEKFGG